MFLGERFASFHAIGILLVLGGIWVAERVRPAS
jgi:drug/metabolite transporter (DMT)-like permease